MRMCLPDDVRERIAKSLYIINKEAKRLRDEGDHISKDHLYYLKDAVLCDLNDMGEVEVDGYHILYYVYDDDEEDDIYIEEDCGSPVFGVLLRMGNFTYHFVTDDEEYLYGMFGTDIRELGELDNIIPAKIDRSKKYSDHDQFDFPDPEEAERFLRDFLDRKIRFYPDSIDQLYAQFGL